MEYYALLLSDSSEYFKGVPAFSGFFGCLTLKIKAS
jgi:hypothetical protein